MSFFDGRFKISACVASGVEAIAKRELSSLGYMDIPAISGRLTFDGNMMDVARCNMFLRTVNRIRIAVDSFFAETFDELFDGISAMPWEEIIPRNGKVLVAAKSVKSKLFALSAIQSIVKKAICEKLKKAYQLTVLPEDGEEYSIEASVLMDNFQISIDTSGDGLHKRGYRTFVGAAPLKETLAAAILKLSVWKSDRPLIDPFTGSGTIPIEAALIATNTAPGILRNFAFEKFSFAPDVIDVVREEAKDSVISAENLRISAFDIDPRAIKLALKHADAAGMRQHIHFQASDMRTISSRFSHGVIVANPPYGERLLKEKELKDLYYDFGKVYRSLDEWSCYTLTAYNAFEKYFGKRADKVRRLYNSELECMLYQFLGAPPKRRDNESVSTEG